MRNAVIAMLSLAALAASAQRPWTPATEGWTTGKIAQAEARASSNAAAQVAAVLTNGLFSGATLAGDTVLTGGVTRAYGGLEAVVESGLAVYGASPDTHGVRGSSGTGGYGVYGTTYAGWAGVAGFGTLAPGIYGSGGVGYPGGWFVGDTGASPAGVATGLIAEAGLDRTQPGLYTPNSVHAYAFYGSGGALTGITERALSAGPSNVIVSALTVTGRQDIVAGAMFTTPGYAGAAGGVDGWALYPDSYQGLSQGAAWTLGAGALEWRDENKQARADTWGLWMRDIETDLYLSLSGDFLKAREGSKYSHWTGFHRRKTTGISVYTNAATEDVIVAMHEHEADADAHAGLFLSGPDATNLVMTLGGGVIASSHGVVLGDSTIAAYAGGTEVASLLVTAGDRLAGNSVTNLAVPGHTIAQQYTAWTNYAGRATSVWVAVQVGLNDLLPAANVTNVVADYQSLVNRIRADAPTAKVLVATMTPAKQRYIDVYGGTGGAASYAWWLFLNTAIMGGGTHPVTNVDMRVSSHTDVLNDGAGNLASVYDTGDHVHENTAARTVIAAEWRRALNVAGLLPASASSWYRDTIVSEQVNALDTRLSTEKLDVEDGTAYRLVSRQGMTFYENSVRLFPAWTNGVPVLAVSISGTNYVFNLQTPLNFSETAPAWYDALALDSVWPVDEGAGTNLLDASSVRNAWLSGTTAWATHNGADCVYLDGTSGKGSIGDFYDVGTNSFMLGAWFCLTNLPATSAAGLVSKAAGYGYEVSFYLSSSGILASQCRNGAGASLLNMVGSVPVSTGIWHHAALVVNRSAGAAIILDGQTYLSATNTLSGVDFQSAEPMVFGSRNLANTYLKGFLGSVQIDLTADTNTAVSVWNASRTTYGR